MSRLLLLLALGLGASAPAASWSGFLDARGGGRTGNDPLQDDRSLSELRLQVDVQDYLGPLDFQVKADFLYDDLANDRSEIDLERGRGWLDLRTAYLGAMPFDWMDLKAGRQVLTWGTGDMLFINDLFPKDWVSFFTGRDVEYLKAPSDALWAGIYLGPWTLDLTWMPEFDADRFLNGERISFWPGVFSADAPLLVEEPDQGEFALRLARTIGSTEWALYAYQGFWKSPAGFDTAGRGLFPELQVLGASVLTPLGAGLFNLELGYYDSTDDPDGGDPFIRNSESRVLLGYSRELARDFSLGVQAYLEWRMDQDAYLASLPEGQVAADEVRQVATLRLTRMLMNQNLILSGFLYYSPNEEDGYLRASVEYKWSDRLSTTLGANWFFGEEDHTFFGQLEDNSNLYAALRWWL